MSPVTDRMNAMHPEGRRPTSGFHAFCRTLGQPGAAAGYAQWSDQMMTRLVANAIRDIIFNQPIPEASSDQVSVQFGITQGLEIAYQLLTDPSVLVPGIYGKGTNPAAEPTTPPSENFDTPADGVV